MKLIHRERIQEFIQLHPDARSSLKAWALLMESNDFKNPAALKQACRSADYVRPFWVFNIAGNKYRLIALIDFSLSLAAIEDVLTHTEYDKGKWRK